MINILPTSVEFNTILNNNSMNDMVVMGERFRIYEGRTIICLSYDLKTPI